MHRRTAVLEPAACLLFDAESPELEGLPPPAPVETVSLSGLPLETLPLLNRGADMLPGEAIPATAPGEHRWVRSAVVFDHDREEVLEYRCIDCGASEYVTRRHRLPRGYCR